MTRIEDLNNEELGKLREMEKDFKRFYSDRSELSDKATVEYIERLYTHAGFDKKPVVLFAADPGLQDYRAKYEAINTDGGYDLVMDLFHTRNGMKGKNPDDYPKDLSNVLDWEAFKVDGQWQDDIIAEAKKSKSRSYFAFMCSAYTRAYLGWFYFLKTVRGEDVDHWDFLEKAYPLSLQSDVCRAFFAEEVVLVLRLPKAIHATGNIIDGETLHNVDGPAIEYDTVKAYYVNGRSVEEKYFTEEITFDMFQRCENEDERAAMVDIVQARKGQEGLLKFLGAKMVDEKEIEHFPGYKETIRLYKTEESYSHLNDQHGNPNQPYCWTSIVCPSTGTNYLIATCPTFNDAEAALAWLRPSWVPQELKYQWENFAN